ncbi:HEAT repeat domain-containing protein [Micromonospora sp. NPDC047074]|uniref:HEAT repeat domain-containing protein n=1 Tax=Micromonospora sp. NPDC047074 TaxID=3154339 RepID=UPI0033E27AE7
MEPGIRWVPGWAVRTERWLPRQQARFVQLQELVAADTGQGVWRRAAAIRVAARFGDAGRELVLRHLDAPEVAIAEAALGALVWTDRPAEALPVLLRYADGDRARVASYAAGRAVRHVPPSRLPDVLGAVLTGPAKITSRKEAVRLLARYGPPQAMATLLDVHTDPDTHRDVRAAAVSAARQRLGSEASWTILRSAIDGSREERRAVLLTYPYTIPERHRPRYGALVVEACRAADREVRRVAFGQLGEWSPWLAGTTELVVDRLTDLDETIVHIEAAGLLKAGGDAALGAALARLVDRDASDDRPGDPVADRPARRRIALLARGAVVLSGTRPVNSDRTVLVESARWLARQPAFAGTATGLLVDLGRLDDLDEVAGLCAGRPVLAVRCAERVGVRLRGLRERPDPARLADIVARLAGRGDLAGGLFAVALVRHGAGVGWKEPWRDLLHGLRRHPDADVREEAYAVEMS